MVWRLLGGAIMVAWLAGGAPARAEGPMTPLRPLPPGTPHETIAPSADAAPPQAPPTSVEPVSAPATAKPAPEKSTLAAAPAEIATKAANAMSTAPDAVDDKPEAAVTAPPPHAKHHAYRASWRSNRVASRSYRARYSSNTLSAASTPYTPGFGPAPYSSSGY